MLPIFHKEKKLINDMLPVDQRRKKGIHFGKINKEKEQNEEEKNPYENLLSVDYLVKEIMTTFNQILRANVYENSFSKEEIEHRLVMKKELRKSLRNCAFGDEKAKTYVKDYIKEILIKKYKINEQNINRIIYFLLESQLEGQDKFEILLYQQEKLYKKEALERLILTYQLDKPRINLEGEIYYEIDEQAINEAYQNCRKFLDFNDQLEIVTRRIYQLYKGNGVIDQIRDMKVDGVSAGVSGIPESVEMDSIKAKEILPASYDSIWIFFQGKSIHLSFLSFKTYKELTRVCKNIYRYNNPGQLSEVTGYTVNEMKDGSRIAVARPPFCESWVLFVRKFDTILQDDIHNIITDRNNELPIMIMRWLIKGCQVTGITGEQGSGKTTLLMALISFINPTYNLRIQELSFELHLRKIYPKRNIVTFREINDISGQEGLDFQKKTDGTVNILGEVASAPVANWLVQMSLVASLFTVFTHHAKTTKDLIIALRNALLLEGGFSNEYVATEQVIHTINFDIHMRKLVDGHRYIERITEIIPSEESLYEKEDNEVRKIKNDLTGEMFYLKDIVVFEENQYKLKNYFSKRTMRDMTKNLAKEEITKLYQFFSDWGLNYSEQLHK